MVAIQTEELPQTGFEPVVPTTKVRPLCVKQHVSSAY